MSWVGAKPGNRGNEDAICITYYLYYIVLNLDLLHTLIILLTPFLLTYYIIYFIIYYNKAFTFLIKKQLV
jgi:hypothetical protein